jgi:hypothetical protein
MSHSWKYNGALLFCKNNIIKEKKNKFNQITSGERERENSKICKHIIKIRGAKELRDEPMKNQIKSNVTYFEGWYEGWKE